VLRNVNTGASNAPVLTLRSTKSDEPALWTGAMPADCHSKPTADVAEEGGALVMLCC